MKRDVIIIGCGPAGLSAAVYACRAGLDVLMLDAGAPGGKINLTAELENWPGDKRVAGPELAYRMYEHATEVGAEYAYGRVIDIKDFSTHKEVICEDATYKAKAVIIASGTKERQMGLAKEVELTGRGISYCAVCDGPFFKNEEVIVVGGGNSALQEAEYLTTFASKVHLVVRRDVFRADMAVSNKVLNNDKIEIHFLRKPYEILEKDNKVAGLVVEDALTHEKETIEAKAIFPFVGLDPVTDFAKDLGITDEAGYILTDENMETKVKGIFAAGDVRQKTLRQVVTATNDGAIAAQTIAHRLG